MAASFQNFCQYTMPELPIQFPTLLMLVSMPNKISQALPCFKIEMRILLEMVSAYWYDMRPVRPMSSLMGVSGLSCWENISCWKIILLWTLNKCQSHFIISLVNHVMIPFILVNYIQRNTGSWQVSLQSKYSRSWYMYELFLVVVSPYNIHGQH